MTATNREGCVHAFIKCNRAILSGPPDKATTRFAFDFYSLCTNSKNTGFILHCFINSANSSFDIGDWFVYDSENRRETAGRPNRYNATDLLIDTGRQRNMVCFDFSLGAGVSVEEVNLSSSISYSLGVEFSSNES